MKGQETTDAVIEENAPRSGAAGLLVLAALALWLGRTNGLIAVAFVVAIVVMVFLHELGHYLTAKAAGMKVTEFFIGFGPRLWSFRRGETEYGIKAIPILAYVRIIGMSNLEEVDPADEERTYRAKPYWRRMSVALAGSTMHFLIAFALIGVVFMGFGRPDASSDKWTLQTVAGPALKAGLEPGDRIVSLNGRRYADFEALSDAIHVLPGERVSVVIERDGVERTFEATLADNNPVSHEKVGYLGVSPRLPTVRSGPVEGVTDGLRAMGSATKESVLGIGRLFSPSGISGYVDTVANKGAGSGSATSPENANRPTSVIGLVHVGTQVAKNGIADLLVLLFVFNMFIGIFNLTPLLPFDGGHAVIATYEKIRSMLSGRRYQADVAKLMPLTYAVVVVLILLFVTTSYLDITRPLSVR